MSVGPWPGGECEIVAGVRAAGVTRGWGRKNPEPGGPDPDPSPSGVGILGLENPKGGREAWGLTRKGWKTRTGLYRVGVSRRVGVGGWFGRVFGVVL